MAVDSSKMPELHDISAVINDSAVLKYRSIKHNGDEKRYLENVDFNAILNRS